MREYYVGLMSGTSIDGIDAVLVAFENGKSTIVESLSLDYDDNTSQLLHSLCTPSSDEIEKMGEAKVSLANYEAKATLMLLDKAKVKSEDVVAIGSHGQTVRHCPLKHFSIQLDDGARVAALTHIDTICDFRAKDLALDGNGAPLTQAFHVKQFADDKYFTMVLNMGGISNLTVINAGSSPKVLCAYDTGPANTLLDTTMRLLKNTPYDKDAKVASQGKVLDELLARYLKTPYFALKPPKSTGRELFNADFIKEELLLASLKPEFVNDLMATLTELTVLVNVNAIRECLYRYTPEYKRLILCGGGAYNPLIVSRLTKHLEKNEVKILKAEDLGVNSKLIEAHAFAYFAYKFVHREPLDLCDSTEAKKPGILGCLYPKD